MFHTSHWFVQKYMCFSAHLHSFSLNILLIIAIQELGLHIGQYTKLNAASVVIRLDLI